MADVRALGGTMNASLERLGSSDSEDEFVYGEDEDEDDERVSSSGVKNSERVVPRLHKSTAKAL